ncbi:PorT family protein [Bacteroidales bacterium OttesenSCG-928-A17]|nr:PorT family protein [Bacteroidales bacterium OttesenSCG-928-A17]
MRKNIFILFLFFSCAFNLFSQTQKVKNQPYGDHKLYHFGVTVGMNFQDIILTNSGFAGDNGETWFATIPSYSPGFSVGLMADLYLNPYMNLRFTPLLSFGDKVFEFVNPATDERLRTNVRSNYLMAPLDLKFRAMRLNNYRPYVLAGAYAVMDLGIKKDEPVLLKRMDYGLTIGLGCDFYLPIVKVVPEIRFCFGLKDIIEKDRSDLRDQSLLKYTQAISKGVSRMIIITFTFE